ncbi:MAG TPA: serine/threonine-protein kinase [Ktedonobacterales bacterium]|nr:serine/threonine-protein kinase [Ktedonobacterales bacterium]
MTEQLDYFLTEADRQAVLPQFEEAARQRMALRHPAIPVVLEYFFANGRPFQVEEWVAGQTLDAVLQQDGQPYGLPEARVRSWAVQLCDALAFLHSRQPPILFRVMKPTNLLLTPSEHLKLLHLAVVLFPKEPVRVVMRMGYAPPEQLRGNPEPRSDLYALGATLHRLLTQHDASTNRPSVFDFPTIRSFRPEVTPEFDGIIGQALQRDPQTRWVSAQAMGQAVQHLPPLQTARA